MVPFSDTIFYLGEEEVLLADPELFPKLEKYLVLLHRQVIKPGTACYPSFPCKFGEPI